VTTCDNRVTVAIEEINDVPLKRSTITMYIQAYGVHMYISTTSTSIKERLQLQHQALRSGKTVYVLPLGHVSHFWNGVRFEITIKTPLKLCTRLCTF
jgi:hypothetical protein